MLPSLFPVPFNGWLPNVPLDYIPFSGPPTLPHMAPILFEDYAPAPYEMYQQDIPPYKMYHSDLPPSEVYQPEPFRYEIYQPEINPPYELYQPGPVPFNIPQPDLFPYPSPHQMLPVEQYPRLLKQRTNDPITKVGMTFPKPEPIREQMQLPQSFEKFMPEKIGFTFPSNNFARDRTFPMNNYPTERQYNPPMNFNHQSARMEPIMVQNSPTLSMLANLWNKKQ